MKKTADEEKLFQEDMARIAKSMGLGFAALSVQFEREIKRVDAEWKKDKLGKMGHYWAGYSNGLGFALESIKAMQEKLAADSNVRGF